MPLWTPPPAPSTSDVTNAVENAAGDAVDEAGKVVDAVIDAVEGGGDPNSGGPPPVPVPNQPIGELVNAVQIFADNGARIIDQISGGAENAIGTVADGVSDALARALPIVIGFLSDVAELGGVGTKVSGLIDRVASKVDQLVGVVASPNGGKTDTGPPPNSDPGNGLRELARAVNRDPSWRKQYLKRTAYQLAARPRAPIAKDGLGKSSDGGAAAAQRMLVQLSTFEEKLRRLEMLLAARAPKSVAERAALTRFRISLGVVVQQGGAQLASKAAFANASIASGLVKGKL